MIVDKSGLKPLISFIINHGLKSVVNTSLFNLLALAMTI